MGWTGLFGRVGLPGLVLPLALYAFLRANPAWDVLIQVPTTHFHVVSLVSLLAFLLALAMGVAGHRLHNGQVTAVALAFISLAELFTVHGLATPGPWLGATAVPKLAAQVSLTLCAGWLAIAALPTDHPVARACSRHHHILLPVWATAVAGAGAWSLHQAHLFAGAGPLDTPAGRLGSGLLVATTLVMALYAAIQFSRAYRYARLPLPWALAVGACWVAVAQVILVTAAVWRLSWWLYHGYLLLAVAAVVVGLARQYTPGRGLSAAFYGLVLSDPAARREAGLSDRVRALAVATEARDPYTAGHSLRVTLLALRIAEAMHLPPEAIRALVQGGILHDVGKIAISDAILNKPGALTPEERREVEQHPIRGYEIGRRIGLPPEALAVIRSHHERWDGQGYPDGLRGEAIPLLARILAVADVYDALTSDRAYRKGWSPAEARQYILAQAGSQFDPDCVAAWASLEEPPPRKPGWLDRAAAGELGPSVPEWGDAGSARP